MKKMRLLIGSLGLLSVVGCGSAYKGVVDQSGLGAEQYIPAVYIEPGQEAKYQQVLPICRQAALNRQMTAAQEAQLKTLTGTAQSHRRRGGGSCPVWADIRYGWGRC